MKRRLRLSKTCEKCKSNSALTRFIWCESCIDLYSVGINNYAIRSFCDIADKDYIMARIAYRKGADFSTQFLWASLQGIEKYLKAILLLNRISYKSTKHDLVDLLQKVENIKGLKFSLPKEIKKFIEYISTYGDNRYFDRSYYLDYSALRLLDETVWHIRPYCFCTTLCICNSTKCDKMTTMQGCRSNSPNEVQRKLKCLRKKQHLSYKYFGGFLREVIEKRLSSYDDLVWKNCFFGRVKKKNNLFRRVGYSANPTYLVGNVRYDLFNELDGWIFFPSKVKKMFKQTNASNAPTT